MKTNQDNGYYDGLEEAMGLSRDPAEEISCTVGRERIPYLSRNILKRETERLKPRGNNSVKTEP